MLHARFWSGSAVRHRSSKGRTLATIPKGAPGSARSSTFSGFRSPWMIFFEWLQGGRNSPCKHQVTGCDARGTKHVLMQLHACSSCKRKHVGTHMYSMPATMSISTERMESMWGSPVSRSCSTHSTRAARSVAWHSSCGSNAKNQCMHFRSCEIMARAVLIACATRA